MSSNATDGGWGWVVCFACFVVHLLIDGMQYSSGVLFVTLLDYFNESKGNTSIVASLAPSICFIIGPFVAVLVNRFGCRAVAIAGGLVATISQFISVFATSLQFLYLTLGILTGIGYGVAYLPSIVAVNQYFSDKKRSMAIGLAVSGTGFGTFIFGPMMDYLIGAYTWRGAVLILSALMLNTVACGLIYRPVKTAETTVYLNSNSTHRFEINGNSDNTPLLAPSVFDDDREYSLSDVEELSTEVKPVISDKDSMNYANKLETIWIRTPFIGTAQDTDSSDCNDGDSVYSEQDINSLAARNRYHWGTKRTSSLISDIIRYGHELKTTIKNARMFLLLRNVWFAAFALHSFLYGLGFLVIFVYLPDMAIEAGIEQAKASWLVSCLGITNIIGRIFFGYIAGLSLVNELYLYSIAVAICGLAMTIGPLLNALWSLMVYAGIVGFFSGVAISLTSVVCIQLVGTELLADAFGVSLLFDGIGACIGTPLAGWMYDASGSYLYSYIFAGLSIALSGVMMFGVSLCRGQSDSFR